MNYELRRVVRRVVRGGQEGVRAPIKSRINKHWVVRLKVALSLVLYVVIFVATVVEIEHLDRTSKGLFRADHDPTCFFHLHPYDNGGNEYEVEPTQNSTLGALFDMKKHFLSGKQSKFKSAECELIIVTDDSGRVKLYHADLREVQFPSCLAPQGGSISFVNSSQLKNAMRPTGIITLIAWSLLITLKTMRELFSVSYDSAHPPTTTNKKGSIPTPCPLSHLLVKVTGASRLSPPNIFRTVVRPYLLFAFLSSITLKPFTTVHIHECPQLVMQKGEVWTTLIGSGVGLLVALMALINWFVDWNYFNEYFNDVIRGYEEPDESMFTRWHKRFERWENREHAYKKQEYAENAFCILIASGYICRLIFIAIVSNDFDFAVEVRWIFIPVSNDPISRWSHVLRVFALILWLLDTVFALAKLRTRGSLEDQVRTLKAGNVSRLRQRMQEDQEFALAAIRQDGNNLKYASSELQADVEIVALACQHGLLKPSDVELGSSLDDELKNNPQFVLAAVKYSGRLLEFASEELKGDRKIVTAAVKQDGHALEHASAELKSDLGFVWAAVRTWPWLKDRSYLRDWNVPRNVIDECCGAPPSRSASPAPAPRAPAGDGPIICKFGCGRRAKSGFTRGGNPFDTCCRACAMTKGGGEHDANCGS